MTSSTADARPATPSPAHCGMGAIPHAAGVAFRLWAPNASAVSVVGTFNDWDPARQEFLQGAWFEDTVPLDWDRAEEYRGIR